MVRKPLLASCAAVLALIPAAALGAARDVQLRSINFTTGIIELHNFGAVTESLTGWRFCTQDSDEVLQYTGLNGLNGRSVAAGASFFIHFNNDAPANPAHINKSALLGQWAEPLDNDAYGLSLFWPNGGSIVFGDPNDMADHVQWNIGGADNTTADERSDEAQNAGLWTNQSLWVSTSVTTTYLRLNDTSGAILHGPASYDALDVMPDCQPNGVDDYFDIFDGTSLDGNMNGTPDECEVPSSCDGDADGNNSVNVNDISFVVFRLGNSGASCIDGDADGNGKVNVNDISYVVFRLGTCNPGGCP